MRHLEQVHQEKSRMQVHRGRGKGRSTGNDYLTGTEFLFGTMKRILEMDGSGICTSRMYCHLTGRLKMTKIVIFRLFYHNNNKKSFGKDSHG